MKERKNKGITLISLVITIIVLLILAGITISGIVGNDGILNQSQNAKTKTDLAKEQELRDLTMGEAMTNLELTFYQDGGNKVPIPAGFAVSQVEGENKVDKGLVIIDSNGNEFVWIPCGTKQANGTYDTTKYVEAKDYVKNKSWSEHQYKDKNWNNTDSNGKDNTETKKQSIEKYGGFYVARFEAGVPSDAPFHISKTSGDNYVGIDGEHIVLNNNARGSNSETDQIQKFKPVSKRGMQAWNFITQQNAKIVSEKMYKDNDTVDSYLIDSNAWNHICQSIFIEKFKLNVNDSKEYGNYYNNKTTDYTRLDCLWALHTFTGSTWTSVTEYRKGSITTEAPKGNGNDKLELATGASDDFKVYNIYDMAGNMWEWTEETSNENVPRFGSFRGGGFFSKGEEKPVVRADGDMSPTDYCQAVQGFRTVLYVK